MLAMTKDTGGLRLVNLHIKQVSLLVQWIFTLSDNIFFQRAIYSALARPLGSAIWNCNLNTSDVCKLFPRNSFSRGVEHWSIHNYYESVSYSVV